jgi:hypothetical protein
MLNHGWTNITATVLEKLIRINKLQYCGSNNINKQQEFYSLPKRYSKIRCGEECDSVSLKNKDFFKLIFMYMGSNELLKYISEPSSIHIIVRLIFGMPLF